jgi:hypothetical protein
MTLERRRRSRPTGSRTSATPAVISSSRWTSGRTRGSGLQGNSSPPRPRRNRSSSTDTSTRPRVRTCSRSACEQTAASVGTATPVLSVR